MWDSVLHIVCRYAYNMIFKLTKSSKMGHSKEICSCPRFADSRWEQTVPPLSGNALLMKYSSSEKKNVSYLFSFTSSTTTLHMSSNAGTKIHCRSRLNVNILYLRISILISNTHVQICIYSIQSPCRFYKYHYTY